MTGEHKFCNGTLELGWMDGWKSEFLDTASDSPFDGSFIHKVVVRNGSVRILCEASTYLSFNLHLKWSQLRIYILFTD